MTCTLATRRTERTSDRVWR